MTYNEMLSKPGFYRVDGDSQNDYVFVVLEDKKLFYVYREDYSPLYVTNDKDCRELWGEDTFAKMEVRGETNEN